MFRLLVGFGYFVCCLLFCFELFGCLISSLLNSVVHAYFCV